MQPALEVADVFRRYGEAYRRAHGAQLGRGARRVMAAIETCRTAALGGHAERCAACGLVRLAYNSCRNRHCPKCQSLSRAAWLAARQAELLPVPYFHVVFTVPSPVAGSALQNKAVVYAILCRAAAETLRTIAPTPSTSVPNSAWSRCCIPGVRTSITIRMSIVLSPAVGSRSTAPGGSRVGPASFSRCRCSHASFVDFFWSSFKPHTRLAASPSSVPSPASPIQPPSPAGNGRYARSTG